MSLLDLTNRVKFRHSFMRPRHMGRQIFAPEDGDRGAFRYVQDVVRSRVSREPKVTDAKADRDRQAERETPKSRSFHFSRCEQSYR